MTISRRILPISHFAIVFTLLWSAGAYAQTRGSESASVQTKSSLDILVLKGNPTVITLRAEKVPLREVAMRLAQKLKAAVQVSPKLKFATVSMTRTKVPLETLVYELAPQVYLDYVLSGGRDAYPHCRAVYLQALDEAAPVGTASVQPRSQAFLIEGNTEDSTAAPSEAPLQVSLLQGRLSVRARRQPLSVVLAEIARQCQIPFEMRYETRSTIDLDFQGVPLINFPQALPVEVQMYYRTNLRTLAVKPLYLMLVKPDPTEKPL